MGVCLSRPTPKQPSCTPLSSKALAPMFCPGSYLVPIKQLRVQPLALAPLACGEKEARSGPHPAGSPAQPPFPAHTWEDRRVGQQSVETGGSHRGHRERLGLAGAAGRHLRGRPVAGGCRREQLPLPGGRGKLQREEGVRQCTGEGAGQLSDYTHPSPTN